MVGELISLLMSECDYCDDGKKEETQGLRKKCYIHRDIDIGLGAQHGPRVVHMDQAILSSLLLLLEGAT